MKEKTKSPETQTKESWNGYCDKSDYSGDTRCTRQCELCSTMPEDMIPFAKMAGEAKADGDQNILGTTLKILADS